MGFSPTSTPTPTVWAVRSPRGTAGWSKCFAGYEVPFNTHIECGDYERSVPIVLKRKDFGFRGSGPVDKADLRTLFCIKDGALCRSEASFDSVGDDPDDPDILQLGYVNDYSGIDKLALPVTLVAHAQEADLTVFGLDRFERDFLVRCSQVQGGLVTLERVPPVHISFFDNKTSRLRCYYPVGVRIRDSIRYAPPGKRGGSPPSGMSSTYRS